MLSGNVPHLPCFRELPAAVTTVYLIFSSSTRKISNSVVFPFLS